MKTFYDLSTEEKLQLTSEQIDYYARLDCANSGVIIPARPIEQTSIVAQPTHEFHSVGYESYYFDNLAEAKTYADLKNKALQSKTIGKHKFSCKNDYTQELMTTKMYTQEEANDLKGVLEKNASIEKEWKDYEIALKGYNEAHAAISTEISNLRYRENRVNHFQKVFDDYLELAGNNQKIAFNFFEKAYASANLDDVDSEIVSDTLKMKAVIENKSK